MDLGILSLSDTNTTKCRVIPLWPKRASMEPLGMPHWRSLDLDIFALGEHQSPEYALCSPVPRCMVGYEGV